MYLEHLPRVALLGVFALLHELGAAERIHKGRLELISDCERSKLLLVQVELLVCIAKAAHASAATATARSLVRLLGPLSHRQSDAPLGFLHLSDAHLHLLPNAQHIGDLADTAILDLRDVHQAIDTLLDGDKRAEVSDRVDLALNELFRVRTLELAQIWAIARSRLAS